MLTKATSTGGLSLRLELDTQAQDSSAMLSREQCYNRHLRLADIAIRLVREIELIVLVVIFVLAWSMSK